MKRIFKSFLLLLCTTSPFIPINSQGGSGTVLHSIYFVIDNSGSMRQNDPGFIVKDVIRKMTDSLNPQFYAGIILFSKNAQVVLPLTKLNDLQKDALSAVLNQINYTGENTNIPDAMERAIYDLKQYETKEISGSIILLTDGFIDLPDKKMNQSKRQWLINSLAKEARDAGIQIFGIAFSDKTDFELIQEIANRTNGEYFRVYTTDEISDVFSKIRNKLNAVPQEQPAAQIKTPSPVILEKRVEKESNWISWLIAGISLLILVLLVTGLIWLLRRKKGLLQQEKPVSQSIGNHHPLVPPARLLDLDKSSDQDEYIIQNEVTSIGRSPENNIIIANDPAVTRYNHAQIIFQDNKFYLKDLSANYSKINDKKIDKRVLVELNDGDVISIMENRFRFSLPVENKTVIFDENQFLIDQSRETEIMGNTP